MSKACKKCGYSPTEDDKELCKDCYMDKQFSGDGTKRTDLLLLNDW